MVARKGTCGTALACLGLLGSPVASRLTIVGCLVAAVTFSACGDTDAPGGPDFERELGPGEYQVSVTGDVQRSFETKGATYLEFPHIVGFERGRLYLWEDTDVFNGLHGAQFDICAAAQQGAYPFDARGGWVGCPTDLSRATGGFIVQLGVPDYELDCYPTGTGGEDFEGVLSITSTDSDIRGEAQGNGTCSLRPRTAVGPVRQAAVSVRMRFRAVRSTS